MCRYVRVFHVNALPYSYEFRARVFFHAFIYFHLILFPFFYSFITLSAVVCNYNINIIMLINTLKVRDGRSRVYKKYVYKCLSLHPSLTFSFINQRTTHYSTLSLLCAVYSFIHSQFLSHFSLSIIFYLPLLISFTLFKSLFLLLI